MSVDPASIQSSGSRFAKIASLITSAREGGAFGGQLFHVQDEKAQNANGGGFTSGAFRTRDLGDLAGPGNPKTNEISGASLASNQITLPAGTFWIDASAPANFVDEHQCRIRDITNSADLLIGTSEFSRASTLQLPTRSFVSGRITLISSTVIELQHQCSVTRATDGFGKASNFTTEVYSILKIWKVR